MPESNPKRVDDVALFRYGLIADLQHFPRGSLEISRLLREKAEKTYNVPYSQRTYVAAETMRHWLKLFRHGGFEALKPQPRHDVGVSRTLPRDVADTLCRLKEENPELSVQLLIKRAVAAGSVPVHIHLPPSTVHRLLSKAGLMKAPASPALDHRRFGFEHANELWMSDVMHGPSVIFEGKKRRKSYLIAFIDDATRVVPFATFAFSESASAFLPQLYQAIMRRGIPKRLFVDNGAAYRSRHLQLVCARLGITLIHARPYHPEAKGKQERWFRTVRLQFLPTLQDADTQSLATLNARLWGWVEGEYHQAPHRGIDKMTPLEAWAQRAEDVEHVGARKDLADLFLFEQRRKVRRDRTVSLDGQDYEVEAALVGTQVTLRYDPAKMACIQVWSAEGKRFGDARVVDIYTNRLVKRAAPASESGLRLRDLDTEGAR